MPYVLSYNTNKSLEIIVDVTFRDYLGCFLCGILTGFFLLLSDYSIITVCYIICSNTNINLCELLMNLRVAFSGDGGR